MKDRHVTRKMNRAVLLVLLALVLAHLSLFHYVRGERIVKPSTDAYQRSVARLVNGPVMVRSTEDMQDLGVVAWRVVGEAGLLPGSFYVLFLPKLDIREKLHHFFHSPFTGLDSIYADIWFNSCTVYGLNESTWGIRRSRVYPADKLSVLIILIDRLKREKTSLQEHLGAYIEVFAGMELHSMPGRARCWVLLMKQCIRDDKLTALVERQLELRRTEDIDAAERDFWNYLQNQPTRNSLELLAASETSPLPSEPQREITYRILFKKLLHEYRSKN
ncbi:MAG: hypothetical protein V2B13_13025 [Pseudomonadota bacterium]